MSKSWEHTQSLTLKSLGRLSSNSIPEQIEAAKSFSRFMCKFPSAASQGLSFDIAGGAPRNWFAGKDCSDIDIFAWDYLESNLIDRIKANNWPIKQMGFDKNDMKIQEYDSYKTFKKFGLITKIYELPWKGELIQLIFLDYDKCILKGFETIEKFVRQTFDFNICKAFFRHGNIIMTEEAEKDFRDKTLTLSIRSLLKYQRIYSLPERADKMQKLFPDHTLKILE